jgi:hypothetical protein
MYQLNLPDGTVRTYQTRAQLFQGIREMKEAYQGYLK